MAIENIDENFTAFDGYIPEKGILKTQTGGAYYHTHRNSWLKLTELGIDVTHAESHADTMAYRSIELYGTQDVFAFNTSGINVAITVCQREPYLDRTVGTGFKWNDESIVANGKVWTDFGIIENDNYLFVSVNQGVPIIEKASLKLRAEVYSKTSPEGVGESSQLAMLTGNYDFSPNHTLALGVVERYSYGGTIEAALGNFDLVNAFTNVFVSYRGRITKKIEVLALIGNPNSPSFEQKVSTKVVVTLP